MIPWNLTRGFVLSDTPTIPGAISFLPSMESINLSIVLATTVAVSLSDTFPATVSPTIDFEPIRERIPESKAPTW